MATVRTAGAAASALVVALLVAGCTAGSGAAPTSPAAGTSTGSGTSAGTSTTTPLPTTPSPTAAAETGTIPTDCKALISSATYAVSFAKIPLNDPSVVGSPVKLPTTVFTPVVVKGGASNYCVWREPQADITSLVIDIRTVDPARASAQLHLLPAKGFTCAEQDGGYRCQKIWIDGQYGVEMGDTYFARGDVGIRILQSNFPTSGLLREVEERVFR